jgi:hypothetical protein
LSTWSSSQASSSPIAIASSVHSASAGWASLATSNLERDHGHVATLLIDAFTESGDTRQATLVGQSFLARATAWEPPSGGEDIAMSEDAMPHFLVPRARAP